MCDPELKKRERELQIKIRDILREEHDKGLHDTPEFWEARNELNALQLQIYRNGNLPQIIVKTKNRE
jgi:hypothetical protein